MIHDLARAAVINRDREIAIARIAGELLSENADVSARHVLGMLAHSSAQRAEWWNDRIPDSKYIGSEPVDSSNDDIIVALDAPTPLHKLAQVMSAIASSYRVQYERVDEMLDGPTARVLTLCIVDAGRDADALTRIL